MVDSTPIDTRQFFYIASIRRSGSTLLSEALTHLPNSFVFREPKLAQRRIGVKPGDAELLAPFGVDLMAFAGTWNGKKDRRILPEFAATIVGRLNQNGIQVGVKEVVHTNWKRYLKTFPEMRVILTARDPRDIYISLHDRVSKGLGRYKEGLTPEQVAKDLDEDFKCQLAMTRKVPTIKVRYEELCTDEGVLRNVMQFVGVSEAGQVGSLLAVNPKRSDEVERHGNTITDRSVKRWSTLDDQKLRAQALQVFRRLKKYCAYWGYEE